MKEHIGHKCKIEICVNTSLFYTAKVINTTDSTITFIDREGKTRTFNINLIKEISEVEENAII